MGAYPFKIDNDNKEHLLIKEEFRNMFHSLKYTLPCGVCQDSYRIFWIEIPIERHLNGRIELMKWLYEIKDRVNKKLICQENKAFKIEKKRIDNIYKTKDIARNEYDKLIKKLKNKICITEKSISFSDVLQIFESKRSK